MQGKLKITLTMHDINRHPKANSLLFPFFSRSLRISKNLVKMAQKNFLECWQYFRFSPGNTWLYLCICRNTWNHMINIYVLYHVKIIKK